MKRKRSEFEEKETEPAGFFNGSIEKGELK